jgi:glycosyltransferase involved in cell wall biosynthesis
VRHRQLEGKAAAGASPSRDGMIAILVNSMGAGGAERAMVNLAGELASRGRPVALIVVREEGPLRDLVAPDVEIVDLRAYRVAAALPALVRWLRAERPRVLLSACANSNVVAVLAARLAGGGIRTVASEQTTLSRVALETRRLRHRLVPPAARWAYPRADAMVAVSSGVADDLESALNLPRDRIDVIPNPLTPGIAAHAAAVPPHAWLRDGGPPVLLAVARLTAAKDLPMLLHAFAKLRAVRPARLLVLGEGEERSRLEALVEQLELGDDVDLAGYCANPYPAMAAADALVLSSRREGLPTVLVEALSLGTPVVATDCLSGPREILEDGRLGRLVPPGDPAAFAEAMEAVLAERRNAPPREARYSLEIVADRYLEVLEPAALVDAASAVAA